MMLSKLIEAINQGLEEADKKTIKSEVYKSKELEKIWTKAQLKKDLKKKHGAKLQKKKKKKKKQGNKVNQPFKEKKILDQEVKAQKGPQRTPPLEDLDLNPWAKALVYQEVFTPRSRSYRRRPRPQKGGKFIAK